MNGTKVIFRFHAVRRMFERKISESEVLEVLNSGETIEDYPADQPYPSSLLCGVVSARPLHVVAAASTESSERIIITVYEPDRDLCGPNFKTRKKS